MKQHELLATLIAFTILPIFNAGALECSAVEYNRKLYESDKTCLAALQNKFTTFSANDSLEGMRFSLIQQYVPVNQDFIVEHIYYEYCKYLASHSGDNVSPTRQEQLLAAKTRLFSRNDSRKIVFDTRNIVNVTPNIGPFQYSNVGNSNANSFMLLSMTLSETTKDHNTVNRGNSIDSLDTLNLLREPPYVITKHNRHFVMVGSHSDLTAAKTTASELKQEYPQLDFVVYDRYPGNLHYSIMMATWVSYDVAQQAEKFAQKHIRKDSRHWSCRSRDGLSC